MRNAMTAKSLSVRAIRRSPELLLAATLALSATAPAHAQDPGCEGPKSDTFINVTVTNVRNASGLIAVTLYADDPRKFLVKHGSLYVGRVPAVAGTTRMCLYLPKPGVWGIAVYHDENANRKIDRGGIVGAPTEGYGFSNNAPTFFSLPSFRSVRLNVAHSGLTSTIKLKYP